MIVAGSDICNCYRDNLEQDIACTYYTNGHPGKIKNETLNDSTAQPATPPGLSTDYHQEPYYVPSGQTGPQSSTSNPFVQFIIQSPTIEQDQIRECNYKV